MPQISGPAVWDAAAIAAAEDSWRLPLPNDLADDMLSAAAAVPDDEANDCGRTRLPLPGFQDLAANIHTELENGVGFVVLSGLPFDRLNAAGRRALTLSLSDHVGQVVPQNYELQRIVDVRDEGIEYSHRSRGYRSAKALPFHTDGAHLFTLTCLDVAEAGGETIIVSASAAYNRLAEDQPEVLPILERGFYHHRRGQHDPGAPPLSAERVPVFAFRDGLLHCCYNRNPVEWAEKEGVVLTAEDRSALDALDAVLEDRSMQLRLDMRPGDMAFINNFVTLHSRTEYQDSSEKRRHMLRVWMRDDASRRAGFSLLDLYVPAAAIEATQAPSRA